MRRWLTVGAFAFSLMFTHACTGAAGKVPATPRAVPQESFQRVTIASPSTAAPSAVPTPSSSTLMTFPPHRAVQPVSSPKATTGPSKVITGEASWGYGFHGHVVTRYPRGTIIRVCGRLGCTGRVRSWGYGPAKYTGRIADLDVGVFENVCGPRGMGVCQIRLEVWK